MGSVSPFLTAVALWALTSVLLQGSLVLLQLLNGRYAWAVAQVFALAIPLAIALFGLRYRVVWQKVLPWYWFCCITCAFGLLLIGLMMRAWMHAFG